MDSAKGGVNDFLVDGITKGYKVESSTPIEQDSNEPDCGMGRLVKLQNPVGLQELVANVKSLLGLKYVQVATSDKQNKSVQLPFVLDLVVVFSKLSRLICTTLVSYPIMKLYISKNWVLLLSAVIIQTQKEHF